MTHGARAVAVVAPPVDDLALLAALRDAGHAGVRVDPARPVLPHGVDAVIVHAFVRDPGRVLAEARARGLAAVLSSAPGASVPPGLERDFSAPADRARVARLRADAYVWREEALLDALGYALGERRGQRSGGPLRLVYLGCAGVARFAGEPPPLGRAFALRAGSAAIVGSDAGAEVRIDAPEVEASHARIQCIEGLVTVADLGSASGTEVDGASAPWPRELGTGGEVSIAGYYRLRLDGAHRGPYR